MVQGYEVVLYLVYATLALGIIVPVIPRRQLKIHRMLAWLAVIIFFVASSILLYNTTAGAVEYYGGLLVHDSFTAAITLAAAIAAIMALMAVDVDAVLWPSHPAYYSLLPLILFGVFFMAGSYDALVLLASWLVVSIASYVFIALPGDRESRGAAVRYIIMGAVATLFLVFWVALHTGIQAGLSKFAYKPYADASLASLAVPALIAALGFKLGIVPFHWWLPSVYGRADGRAVAVVAGVAKLGFIAALARVLYAASVSPEVSSRIALVLAALAVVTMTYGNIAALTTRDLQLILTYSSIAQIGYILVAAAALAYLAPADPRYATLAFAAIAVHSLAYALSKSPLFSAAQELRGGLRGLALRSPVAALSASILLMSLLGVPPLLGFWGKLYMFLAAIKYSLPLVLIALVNSGVSAAYYALAIREMLAKEVKVPTVKDSIEASLLIGALLTVILGLVAPQLLAAFTPIY